MYQIWDFRFNKERGFNKNYSLGEATPNFFNTKNYGHRISESF